MPPHSQPESRRATSVPTAGSSQASEEGESLAEESVVKVCKQCMLSSSGDEVVCPSCGSPLVPIRSVRESYVGETIDETYRLVRKIGSGGMGTVYLGVDDARDEKVAVKFLAKKYAANEQIIMRFLNEARSYGRVTHPNAVTLKEYGQHEDGALYLITEFVDGEPLSRAVQGAGPLTPGSAISVAGQVCGVLSAAHREGVIHRDLKPDNIMLVEDQSGQYHAKVLDFGIAKIVDDERATLTQTGAVFGTPEFMSPEQARGDVADERADIYSLGLILFYACTGKRPFESQNQYKLLDMQQHQPPPRPSDVTEGIDVPAPLERVILTCLEKSADDRYDSAIDLRVELERVAERLNTGPVTVEDGHGEADAASTDGSGEWTSGVDSEGEDTLFLRPFELARRAESDATGDLDLESDQSARRRPRSGSPDRSDIEAELDSVTYAEPGVSSDLDAEDDQLAAARREPGGSLATDLRVADEDSEATPHPSDTDNPVTSMRGEGVIGAVREGASEAIGAAGRVVGAAVDSVWSGAPSNGREAASGWVMELETPDWESALENTERRAQDAASSVGRAWGNGGDGWMSSAAPVVFAALVVAAGVGWGWYNMREDEAPTGSAQAVASSQEATSGPSKKVMDGSAFDRASAAIDAGELARAAEALRGISVDEGTAGAKRRREMLRTVGRMRRLKGSLKRSIDDSACGRARRTLRAIGKTSSGLKAALASDVDNCESMAPAPQPTESTEETKTEAEQGGEADQRRAEASASEEVGQEARGGRPGEASASAEETSGEQAGGSASTVDSSSDEEQTVSEQTAEGAAKGESDNEKADGEPTSQSSDQDAMAAGAPQTDESGAKRGEGELEPDDQPQGAGDGESGVDRPGSPGDESSPAAETTSSETASSQSESSPESRDKKSVDDGGTSRGSDDSEKMALPPKQM